MYGSYSKKRSYSKKGNNYKGKRKNYSKSGRKTVIIKYR